MWCTLFITVNHPTHKIVNQLTFRIPKLIFISRGLLEQISQKAPYTQIPHSSGCLCIYWNEFKNWELARRLRKFFCLERETLAERQSASEDKKLAAKPTKSKSNLWVHFGIFSWDKRPCQKTKREERTKNLSRSRHHQKPILHVVCVYLKLIYFNNKKSFY